MHADPARANRRRLSRRRRTRRRWSIAAVALLGALALAAGVIVSASGAGRSKHPAPAPAPANVLVLQRGANVIARYELARFEHAGRLDTAALEAAVLKGIPRSERIKQANATIFYRYDRAAIARRINRLKPSGGVVDVSPRAVSADIRAPATAQVERNDCEATALSIVLRTSGLRVDQLTLQARMQKSAPLDPSGDGPDRVWGDPELGFVGRADGGGRSGGFGVFQRPVQRLARIYGRRLSDLTGAPASALYQRVLTGHAVMAWVGLSDGPYESWRSSRGRRIRVNFGEHAVALTGVAEDGTVTVKNPLEGTTDHWSRARFEAMWALLGHRALAT